MNEKELIDSDENYRSFVENFQGIAFQGDLNFVPLFFHGKVEEITGYKEENLTSGNPRWSEIIHSKDYEKIVIKDHNSLLNISNYSSEREYRIVNKNGKIRWIHENIQNVSDENGNPYIVQGVIYDITEHKLMEKKLKDSEKKHKSLSHEMEMIIDNIPALIFYKDTENNYIHINKYMADAHHMTKEELMSKDKSELYPPEDVQAYWEDDLKVINSKQPKLNYEEPWKTADGTRWVLTSKIPYIDENDEVKGVIGIATDITERIDDKEKLKKSEEKFRLIVENASDLISVLNDKFEYEYINEPVFKNLLGYSNEDLIGKTNLKLIHPDDLKKTITAASRILRKSIGTHQVRFKHNKGGYKWLEVTAKNFLNSKGEKKIINIYRDITSRKQIDDKLKEVSRLKSDLVTRTSHELKTPLVSIKGYADLLMNKYGDRLDGKLNKPLSIIQDGCERLEDLIGALIESSYLDSGKFKIKANKGDLSFLIKYCVNSLKGLAEAREQDILLNIHDKLITKFEKERIYEVITNLIINAINYSPPKSMIKIQTEVNKEFFIFSIQDNGIGITEEEKKIIFTSFGKIERYGKGWNIGIEGSGLGLYISKKIVELHGGEIWGESEGRNMGSTFSFSLPIK